MKFHIRDPASVPGWIREQTGELERQISARLGRRMRILFTDSVQGATRAPKGPTAAQRVLLLNPDVLEGLGQTSRGIKAWTGLGFHELAHIENPAWPQYRQAQLEGLTFFLNVLDDEQNERRLAQKDRKLGECFALMNQWVERKNREARRASQEGPFSYINLANDFLYYLRRPICPAWLLGILPPDVAAMMKKASIAIATLPAPLKKALNKVPVGLRNLSKPELLELAREIHKILLEAADPGTYDPSKLESPCGCGGSHCHGDHAGTSKDEPQPDGDHSHSGDEKPQPDDDAEGSEEGADRERFPPNPYEDPGEEEEQSPAPALSSLSEELGFDLIEAIELVEPDFSQAEALLPEVVPAAQEMRRYLADCGWGEVELEDQEAGEALGDDFERFYLGDTDICVSDETVTRAAVDLEAIIDCSGSTVGEKFALAKRFGLLVEQATVGLKGVSCRQWGFTDMVIFDCGEPGELRVSGLTAKKEYGNNDSAALWHAAQHAAMSPNPLKILLMISDGAPTECSWESLNKLVQYLESIGYVCVQVATAPIPKPAFERYFIDLSRLTVDEAVIEFGQIVLSLLLNGAPR